MDRRAIVLGLSCALVERGASAQSNRTMPRLGFLGIAARQSDEPMILAFRRGLAELGYEDGRNISILIRSAEGRIERVPDMIAEFASLNVDVLIAAGQAAARAIARATKIPVVALNLPPASSDSDLFVSLARPGGTVTGFSSLGEELSAKRIELLKEALPGLSVVGVLHNSVDPTFLGWGVQTEKGLREHGLRPVRAGLSTPSLSDLRQAIRQLRAEGATALIVVRDFLTSMLGPDICAIALEEKIAVIGETRDLVHRGALMSYGTDVVDQAYRAAAYVDKILKGAKPGDLPIQLATKLELVINLKTARELGLNIAQSVLIRADEVIE
jgi:putative ABC transport system substrate-binding protein